MQNYTSINSDELSKSLHDLLLFIRRIILSILFSIKRFFILFLFILIAILAWGYYQSNQSPKFYSSKMACTYNHLHKKVYGEMIYKLNILAQSQSYSALANQLEITEETASQVVQLEARNIAGSYLYEDITEQQLPFYITAVVTKREAFEPLQTAIINYLNSGIPYHQKRMQLEFERYSEKINFLKTTLEQIDSAIYTFIRNMHVHDAAMDSTSALFGFSNLIRLKEELENRKLSDEKMMQLQMAVEVLHGFVPTEYPNVQTAYSMTKIILLALLKAIVSVVLLNLVFPKNRTQ